MCTKYLQLFPMYFGGYVIRFRDSISSPIYTAKTVDNFSRQFSKFLYKNKVNGQQYLLGRKIRFEYYSFLK